MSDEDSNNPYRWRCYDFDGMGYLLPCSGCRKVFREELIDFVPACSLALLSGWMWSWAGSTCPGCTTIISGGLFAGLDLDGMVHALDDLQGAGAAR